MNTKVQRRHQELFNKMYLGVVKQGKASYSSSLANCVYRGIDNLKCAIGHCIPDDKYMPDFENCGIKTLFYHENDKIKSTIHSIFQEEDLQFLIDVQYYHDTANVEAQCSKNDSLFVEYFKEQMQDVAYMYNLTIPKVD